VFDLGCGDGAISLAVAATGASCVGFEIDAVHLATARRRLAEGPALAGPLEFSNRDIFELDFAACNCLVMFLVPNMLAPLSAIWLQKLRPGTRILSYNFPLPAPWVPEQTREADHHNKPPPAITTVYFYKAGAHADSDAPPEGKEERN
jgi:SAM-dependent methyltransferase